MCGRKTSLQSFADRKKAQKLSRYKCRMQTASSDGNANRHSQREDGTEVSKGTRETEAEAETEVDERDT